MYVPRLTIRSRATNLNNRTADGLLLLKRPDRCAHTQKAASQINGENLVPAALGEVADGIEDVHDAGVVDEDVEAAKPGDHVGSQRVHGLLVGNVRLHGQEPLRRRARAQLLSCRRQPLLVDITDGDVGAGL